jgi:hypothetical protein
MDLRTPRVHRDTPRGAGPLPAVSRRLAAGARLHRPNAMRPVRSAAPSGTGGRVVHDCPISRVQRGTLDNRGADPSAFVRSAEPGAAIRTIDDHDNTVPTLTAKPGGLAKPARRGTTIPGSDSCEISRWKVTRFQHSLGPSCRSPAQSPRSSRYRSDLTHGTSRVGRVRQARSNRGKTQKSVPPRPLRYPLRPLRETPLPRDTPRPRETPRPRDLCYLPSGPRPPGAQRQPQSLGPAVDRLGVLEQ